MNDQISLHIAVEAVANFCNGNVNSASNELKKQVNTVLMAYFQTKAAEEKLTKILIEASARGIELRDVTPNAC